MQHARRRGKRSAMRGGEDALPLDRKDPALAAARTVWGLTRAMSADRSRAEQAAVAALRWGPLSYGSPRRLQRPALLVHAAERAALGSFAPTAPPGAASDAAGGTGATDSTDSGRDVDGDDAARDVALLGAVFRSELPWYFQAVVWAVDVEYERPTAITTLLPMAAASPGRARLQLWHSFALALARREGRVIPSTVPDHATGDPLDVWPHFSVHLVECPLCRTYRPAIEETPRLLARIPGPVPEAVVAAARDALAVAGDAGPRHPIAGMVWERGRPALAVLTSGAVAAVLTVMALGDNRAGDFAVGRVGAPPAAAPSWNTGTPHGPTLVIPATASTPLGPNVAADDDASTSVARRQGAAEASTPDPPSTADVVPATVDVPSAVPAGSANESPAAGDPAGPSTGTEPSGPTTAPAASPPPPSSAAPAPPAGSDQSPPPPPPDDPPPPPDNPPPPGPQPDVVVHVQEGPVDTAVGVGVTKPCAGATVNGASAGTCPPAPGTPSTPPPTLPQPTPPAPAVTTSQPPAASLTPAVAPLAASTSIAPVSTAIAAVPASATNATSLLGS